MSLNNNVSMFYGAKPETFQKAKLLCNKMTQAENKLWTLLKIKSVLNLRFRRQHPLDIFIADFYCHELKLVIEVDGEIHDSKKTQSMIMGEQVS